MKNTNHPQSRYELLIGHAGLDQLRYSKIIVFGVGGVGSVCAEALARCGVGEITIVDGDIVDITNINRQLPSLHSTIGDDKASVMAKRLKDINTVARIVHHNKMWSKDSAFVNLEEYDYVIDAIDAFRDKIDLIETCINKDIMIISSMGAGGRVKGEMFEISDISKTYNDPLAKKVRTELRKRGIDKLKVVFSKELPIKAIDGVVGSAMFAVASTGLLLAQAVISDLIGEKDG